MTTALYRRYRPETFADVIGQEHVTEPLMAAIAGGRTSHAYLFSGPRGCGKTTSARILARCLNCEKGPTPVPCGACASCVELARGGPGSLDVVEIDAASHNGVDDARELRERAAFAPARDRFKIFILDEAHMVTTQGFNALLKLVEEPPPHVKFVFATTEPEKVISTIRSRTHHYPFRLVPPDRLQAYLETICQAEGVPVGSGVLPLVVRAGGGSVRDSLSVLDQLIAGAEGEVDYPYAVALLGFTPATLLDDAVAALEAIDGASVFRVIDRVIESGHDPRRFVEDLLQRLRDLIVVVAAGERAADVLRGVPDDQFRRMASQAERLGLAQLSRAADLTIAALTEMTGATSPRLQLELLCARLLLPAADEGARGYGARLERLERRLQAGGDLGPAPTAVSAPSSVAAPPAAPSESAPAPLRREIPPATSVPPPPRRATERGAGARSASTDTRSAPAGDNSPFSAPEADRESSPSAAPGPDREGPPSAAPAPDRERPPSTAPGPDRERRPASAPTSSAGRAQEQPAPEVPRSRDAGRAGPPGLDTETVRRRWPEVLETLSRIRRASWTITSQNAQVVDLSGDVLRLRFDTSGIASTFRNGQHAQALERALHETLGLTVRVEAVTGDSGPSPALGAGRGSEPGGRRASGPVGGGQESRPPGARQSGGEPGGSNDPRPRAASSPVEDAAADWGMEGGSSRPSPASPSARGQQPARRSHAEHEPAQAPRVARASGARRTAGQGVKEPGSTGAGASGEPPASDQPRPSDEPPLAEPPLEEPPLAEPPLEEPPLDEPPHDEPSPGQGPPPTARAAQASGHARTDGWPPDIDEDDVQGEPFDGSPLVGAPLVERVLGATLIDEIPVGPADSSRRDAT